MPNTNTKSATGHLPPRPTNRKWMNDPLAILINDVLHRHESLCMDSSGDRLTLTEALVTTLREEYG